MKLVPINPIFFILLSALSLNTQAASEKMYRWRDDNNIIIFSDTKPADEAKRRVEALNKNVEVIDIIEKEKTAKQRYLERYFLTLRKQQQSVIDQQKKRDRALLTNFNSIRELKIALQDKMSSFDIQRNVVRRNLERLKNQLNEQQKFAAQFERDGKKIPSKTVSDIRSSKAQIKSTEADIFKRLKQKAKTKQKFEKNIARFSFLLQAKISTRASAYNTPIRARTQAELGLYTCISTVSCNKAWKVAKQFIQAHSTTHLYLETDKIIMSQDPFQKRDLSLSVSKENVDNNQQLFLDIRCHLSSLGKKLCGNLQTKNIRQSFNSFIKSALTTH